MESSARQTSQPTASGQAEVRSSPDAASAEASRLAWVDAARGIAIVLVVLLHARDWLRGAGLDVHLWNPAIEIMNGLRMPVFFAVSGLLGARWLTVAWGRLLSQKVTFIAWVYGVWQAIGSGTALLASRMTGGHMSAVRMVASLAATPVRPRFELWFLWVLIVFFLLARAAVTLAVPVSVQLGVALVLSAWFLSDLVHEGNLGWYGVPKYFAFFLLGIHHRRLVETMVALFRRSYRSLVLAVAVWLVAAVLLYRTGADQYPGPDLLVRLLGLAAGLALAVVLSRWRPLTYLGARTLPVYLAHTPLIIVLAYLAHLVRHRQWVVVGAPAAPLLLTAAVVPLALGLWRAASAGGLGLLYAPPARVTAFVRRVTAG